MTRLPQRHSLVQQLGDILIDEIRGGWWNGWLPEERELARLYQVSRCTVRGALGRLRKGGHIETLHGLGTRVVSGAKHGRQGRIRASIGVLQPRALEGFRHFVTLMVDDLREMLFDRGYRLMIHEHHQAASRRPFELLNKLVAQQRHAGWLLFECGPETQKWFGQHRVPAVVSGTCDPSLGLPFVSLDNYALGRHAAMTLLQHGHRRVGLLLTRSNPNLRSGLSDVFGTGPSAIASPVALEIDDSAGSIAKAVDRLVALAPRPTALFVAESNFYLSAFSRLAQLRLRVPEDISLLCRDDEPYLGSLLPPPSRYSKNPHHYAKRLLSLIVKIIEAEPVAHRGVFIMPDFLPGASLARVIP